MWVEGARVGEFEELSSALIIVSRKAVQSRAVTSTNKAPQPKESWQVPKSDHEVLCDFEETGVWYALLHTESKG